MKKILLFSAALMMAAVSMAQTPTVSASKVTFRYCEATHSSATVNTFDLPVSWEGKTFTEAGVYVETIENARGCDSIVTVTVNETKGALPYPFSVSSTKKVYFSRGNLQYCANPSTGAQGHLTVDGMTSGIWRFAEHQWDFVGGQDLETGTNAAGNVYENGEICDNLKRGVAYSGWIDLFRRGTSGYSSKPYNFSVEAYSVIDGTNYDWGRYNAISNGGNVPQRWYTLSQDEWMYIQDHSTHAKGFVNYVLGLIVLPDNEYWVLPEGCTFSTSNVTSNNYTVEQWEKMEKAGALFLPCTGFFMNQPQQEQYKTSNPNMYSKYSRYWTGEGGNTFYWTNNNVIGNSGDNYRVNVIRISDSTIQTTELQELRSGQEKSGTNGYQYFIPVRLVCDSPTLY